MSDLGNPASPSFLFPIKRFLLLLAALLAFGSIASGQTENIIYRFNGTGGTSPQSRLTADAPGNLYGTTYAGGAHGKGTVFKLSPPATGNRPWVQTVLYSFTGGTDGSHPSSAVIFDPAGNLYGATQVGGNPDHGLGVIYQLQPPAIVGEPWTESVLYTFGTATVPDGLVPFGDLAFDSVGNLYGTTVTGGAGENSACGPSGCGTVFQLKPPATSGGAWTETDIHDFNLPGANDGYAPSAGLVVGPHDVLYGTAGLGGRGTEGTVFKLTPPAMSGGPWTEKTLYGFSGSDGRGPQALALGKNGVIFGSTVHGGAADGGAVFQLTPPSPGSAWTESVLYSFPTQRFGAANPEGIVLDTAGNIYGTTQYSGDLTCFPNSGCGSVFRLSPPAISGGAWTETALHNFVAGPDGNQPVAGLILFKGVLFGTTTLGGSTVAAGAGTVFRVVP